MIYQISVTGEDIAFECTEDETVLDAARVPASGLPKVCFCARPDLARILKSTRKVSRKLNPFLARHSRPKFEKLGIPLLTCQSLV